MPRLQAASEHGLVSEEAVLNARLLSVIRGFHSDNGSEFLNRTVEKLLNKLLIEQTKSRPRHSNDNGLVKSTNGAVIRKHMGYTYIAAPHAGRIQRFYQQHFNPYLNFHRPCGQPEIKTDAKGKQKRVYRHYQTPWEGCVATFKKRQESDWSSRPGSVSCSHLEQLVDELNLSPNIRTAHPPRLPLPDHVHCLVSLDRSARRVEFTKALLGLHSSFDRSMILLQDIVQVLDQPVAATASQDSFFFHSWNRRAVEACLIGIDDAGMRMRWIAESLAKQPFGRRGIA